MGHIGLMPQSVQTAGGYGARGKSRDQVERLLADARAVDEAGAFAMVIESVIEPVAREITSKVSAVTIGIGASLACDGQTLVTEDLVGLFSDFTPPFVKRYAELGSQIGVAAKAFCEDVRARRFPGPEHTFQPKVTSETRAS
jgi:3-methyl-2-oxobutanoate hydroxymethyltransferase